MKPDTLLANLMLARGTLDRAAHLRSDDDWLGGQEAGESAQYLHVVNGQAPIDDEYALVWTTTPTDGERYFLGLDDSDIAHFAVNAASEPPGLSSTWADLRLVGSKLSDEDSGAMTTAVALANWHANHLVCSKCGERSEPVLAGWVRRCTACSAQHFPRTDPAVIMLVIDDDDRALLGRQRVWQEGFFSTLAGFVEPGESAEDAVMREVVEESGVFVGDVQYLGSQPWPFPCSLMLGYHARALTTQITIDDEEIAEARWFSREELVAACRAGEVKLPPDVSIARRLIERWYGEELPGEWSRPPQQRK